MISLNNPHPCSSMIQPQEWRIKNAKRVVYAPGPENRSLLREKTFLDLIKSPLVPN